MMREEEKKHTHTPKTDLDRGDARLEARGELVEDFHEQLLVFANFSHLHDPNDGRLDQQFAVLFYVLVGQLLLYLLANWKQKMNINVM